MNYDDKSGEDELERSKLVGGKGVFVHKYTTSYCNMLDHDHVFKVALRYKNECYQGELATVSEYVAVPFKANFTFDRLGKGKVCTYEKIDLRNSNGRGTGRIVVMLMLLHFGISEMGKHRKSGNLILNIKM